MFLFDNKFESPGRVFQKVQKLMEDYQSASKLDMILTSNQVCNQEKETRR